MLSTTSNGSLSGPWSKRLHHALAEFGEREGTDLAECVEECLDATDPIVRLERFKPRVYRLHLCESSPRSVILKRLEPAAAQRTRLVADRWLPALGLGRCAARLLAAVADRRGDAIWHVYEDVGDETLAAHPDSDRVAAVVDLVAQLHVRAARHPLLPEARHHGRDFGIVYFTSNLRDAIRGIEALRPATLPGNVWDVCARLRDRLTEWLNDVARRSECLSGSGGPETLLHGDLWTTNAFVSTAPERRARLVDWDRVGVGPFSYDLSALIYRFPLEARPEIVARYRQQVETAGWQLPAPDELNLQFETAELARYANCAAWTALAWVQDHADWAPAQLIEVARWFDALEPALPDGWRFPQAGGSRRRIPHPSHRRSRSVPRARPPSGPHRRR